MTKSIVRRGRMVWHYTTQSRLPAILEDGKIRTRSPRVVVPPERPVTWFSLNSQWESTACKGAIPADADLEARRACTSRFGGGLARIGIEVGDAPYGIDDLRRVAGADRDAVEEMIRVGEAVGANPWDWRFTPYEVPARLWRCIDVSDGLGPWIPHGEVPRWDGRPTSTSPTS